MAQTEVIPAKFPKHDVMMMDQLIQKGIFISRSDLLRESVRELIAQREANIQRSDFELMVRKMKEKGDFDSLDGKVLSRLFLDGREKPIKESEFNAGEQKVVRKLLRHPFKILKKAEGNITLTENGIKVARGYLRGLAYLQTAS
ncbi:MAG: ribbon-helix-helix domain-containing protein [Nanoarchaeota archaeon]|nr:ribbon-helix-helix domain-containing protein [Nanoarchaeota archaeon]MBU1946462.1 ribbon-helix-helix domain-containing protein [Nanoarchaeota archaeon]